MADTLPTTSDLDRRLLAGPAVERARSLVDPRGRHGTRPGSMSALVGLTTLMAIEFVRGSGPVLAVHVAGRGVQDVGLALVAVAPVVAVGLVLATVQRVDPRVVMLASGVVLAVARLAIQIVTGAPAAMAAAVGMVAALVLLSLLASLGLPLLGGGVVAGVLLDAALHAALGTRSLIWIDAWWTVLAAGVLVCWHLSLVWSRTRREVTVLGRSPLAAVPLVAIGPVLVVEAFMLGHLGWVGSVVGLGWFGAAVVVGLAGAAGVSAAALSARRPSWLWSFVGVAGGASVVGLGFAMSAPSRWWAGAVILAQVGVGTTLSSAGARGVATGRRWVPLAATVLGYVVLLGVWSVLDGRGVLGVPISPAGVLVLTGVIIAVAAAVSMCQSGPSPHRAGRAEAVSLVGVFMIPGAVLIGGIPSLAALDSPVVHGEVRVVTYNVALALDGRGRPNVEQVARVLVQSEADVVALQEVTRGYLPGAVDMVGWLQYTLGMPHVVFQPSAPGSLHGNAILSRHPIGDVEFREFERRGTALPRGAVAAEIELPGDYRLWFINAHLPPGGSPAERQSRTEAILSLRDDRPHTVLAADLNATAASDIVRRLTDGGLVPAWEMSWGPGETFPARHPRAQIDWVLTSSDVEPLDGIRLHGSGSDHLAVSVVVRLR